MAHSGDTKFAETIKRLTTLYEYGSKASDKAIVEALKLGARQAIDELLTLVGSYKLSQWASFLTHS